METTENIAGQVVGVCIRMVDIGMLEQAVAFAGVHWDEALEYTGHVLWPEQTDA